MMMNCPMMAGQTRQSDGAATADLRYFDKFDSLPPTLLSRADEVIERIAECPLLAHSGHTARS